MIDVIDIIRRLQAEREQAHREPCHVTYNELSAMVAVAVKTELNNAVKKGILEFHKTVNGISFNLKQ